MITTTELERGKRALAIVQELAADNAERKLNDNLWQCHFCDEYNEHHPACYWLQAKELVKDG